MSRTRNEGRRRQGRLAALMAANRAKQGRTDWSAKLTRSFTLKSGDKLVTLADARRVVLAHLMTDFEDFDLTRAMQLLLTAAETGKVADRRAATEQVETVLRGRAFFS
jgi:hypothetical protein